MIYEDNMYNQFVNAERERVMLVQVVLNRWLLWIYIYILYIYNSLKDLKSPTISRALCRRKSGCQSWSFWRSTPSSWMEFFSCKGRHLPCYMDVSENKSTPKPCVHPFWGTPIFGNTHIFSIHTSWLQFRGITITHKPNDYDVSTHSYQLPTISISITQRISTGPHLLL